MTRASLADLEALFRGPALEVEFRPVVVREAPVERKPVVGHIFVGQTIADKRPCCEKARRAECVCALMWSCPDHGERHIGTHD